MRKSPLRKRSVLKRHEPLGSREPLKRSKLRPRSAKYQDIPQEVREEVAARSKGFCEAYVIGYDGCGCAGEGGIPLRGAVAAHLHHRLTRAQGGKHTADNLLHVCFPCHLAIHSQPALSYRMGWLIRGTRADPE